MPAQANPRLPADGQCANARTVRPAGSSARQSDNALAFRGLVRRAPRTWPSLHRPPAAESTLPAASTPALGCPAQAPPVRPARLARNRQGLLPTTYQLRRVAEHGTV